jgi:hypothetical protein
MPKRKTQEELIEDAKKVHGDKYDYSKVNYKKFNEKVTIICKEHGEFQQLLSVHSIGNTCPKCVKNYIDTPYFKEKAIKVHGDKYDYSKVNYTNIKTKVIIICPTHGEYLQEPRLHLSSKGCRQCYKKYTNKKDFIKKANEVHENKYDYSKVSYGSIDEKIIIMCKKHNEEFIQSGSKHLNGQKCPRCSNSVMNTKYFIEKATEIHNNKYDYSKTIYEKTDKKIIIICKKHNCEFMQRANNHLNGNSCPRCSKSFMNTEYFIEKATKVHNNKYDYSEVDYINDKTKVAIKCKNHGIYEMNPSKHLSGKGGCPGCNPAHYSNISIDYLNFISAYHNIKIQHALNKGEFLIPETRYKADGYCKKNNTIFEFHGSLYHGAPSLYKSTDVSFFGKTYGELYANTIKKEKKIKKLGYNLTVMWEHDWKKINKSIKILQKKFKKM